MKPLPSPGKDFDSLKIVFKGKTSRPLLQEARKEEFDREKELVKRAGAVNL